VINLIVLPKFWISTFTAKVYEGDILYLYLTILGFEFSSRRIGMR